MQSPVPTYTTLTANLAYEPLPVLETEVEEIFGKWQSYVDKTYDNLLDSRKFEANETDGASLPPFLANRATQKIIFRLPPVSQANKKPKF